MGSLVLKFLRALLKTTFRRGYGLFVPEWLGASSREAATGKVLKPRIPADHSGRLEDSVRLMQASIQVIRGARRRGQERVTTLPTT